MVDFIVATLNLLPATYINVRLGKRQLSALKSTQTDRPYFCKVKWNLYLNFSLFAEFNRELMGAAIPEGTGDKSEPEKEESE